MITFPIPTISCSQSRSILPMAPYCSHAAHRPFTLSAHRNHASSTLKNSGVACKVWSASLQRILRAAKLSRTDTGPVQQLWLGSFDLSFAKLWVTMPEVFAGSTAEELRNWLHQHGVDPSLYGQGCAKSLADLLQEINKGESTLTVENGRALRSVRVLSLLIKNDLGEVLIEKKQVRPNGSVRSRGLPLSEKLNRAEEWYTAVPRAIKEELGSALPDTPNVSILKDTYARTVETSSSVSYPQLLSQYECHRVQVRVEGLPKENFVTHEAQPTGILQLHWEWCPNWERA